MSNISLLRKAETKYLYFLRTLKLKYRKLNNSSSTKRFSRRIKLTDRFQSRGQQLCKLFGIKESFNTDGKKVQFPQDFFCTQTWPPIHCFVHKYGRRDVM